MVLTDEEKLNVYPAATMEGTFGSSANSMVNFENQFYKIDNTKIVTETSIPSWGTETVPNTKLYYNYNTLPSGNANYPVGAIPVEADGSNKLYQLNATTNKTGLEFVIKVMAGDKIDIMGKSYYLNTTNITNANSTALNLLELMTTFLTAPQNVAGGKGFTASTLNTSNSGILPNSFFRGNNSEPTTTVPKAYINYIIFDEQFKYQSGGASRVGSSGTVKDHWQADASLQDINIPKNGYIFVYVSNESNVDVFFDNLQVIHKPGPILEETHYYPFGLTMAGISSKAAGVTPNKEQTFQDQRFNDEMDLNWVQFKWRNHDPQIGRFIEIDPLSEDYVYNSTYAFSENHVIVHRELEGLEKEYVFAKLWRSAGFSSSSNPKEFVSNVGKEALKPKTWVAGYAAAGQIAAPFVLITIFSGGFGVGAVAQAEARTLSMEVSATTVQRNGVAAVENSVANIATQTGKSIASTVENAAAKGGISVNPSKFDYFFGRVVSGSEHNIARSAQNLKDLTTLGIKSESQLTKVFGQALESGTVISTKTSQYGTTVMKSVNIGNQGSVNVGFFYQGGNMSATPSVSTIIPKIFK